MPRYTHMQDDQYIQFEKMPDFWSRCAQMSIDAPVRKRVYASLYEELIDKCNPGLYMQPYDSKRVSIANDLFNEVLKSKDDEKALSLLRNRASTELGIKFCGDKLYAMLMRYLDPHLYLNPYNHGRLEFANKFYEYIEKYKDDYIALEQIIPEVEDFIEEIDEEVRKLEEEKTIEKTAKEPTKEEADAWRRFHEDLPTLECIRNSLDHDQYKKYIEDTYGGYIKIE